VEGLKRSIQKQGQDRRRQRVEEEQALKGQKGPTKLTKSIRIPVRMTTLSDLDALIQKLQEIKTEIGLYAEVELSFDLQEN